MPRGAASGRAGHYCRLQRRGFARPPQRRLDIPTVDRREEAGVAESERGLEWRCPNCSEEWDGDAFEACPHCGASGVNALCPGCQDAWDMAQELGEPVLCGVCQRE